MDLPFKLISTDFDGTLFAEFEQPPVPLELQQLIGDLQARGVKWAINTGRDMSSLMEALGRAHIDIEPDFLVLVEREIHLHQDSLYISLEEWNAQCTAVHGELFARIRAHLPELVAWINARFHARIYDDPYSPFCLIARDTADMNRIHEYLEQFARRFPGLAVVRNDVYARFCHERYNKGSALAELARRLKLTSAQVFAIGDHLNDLPMLSTRYAGWLAAPANAVAEVKETITRQGGYLSARFHGRGVADALKHYLESHALANST